MRALTFVALSVASLRISDAAAATSPPHPPGCFVGPAGTAERRRCRLSKCAPSCSRARRSSSTASLRSTKEPPTEETAKAKKEKKSGDLPTDLFDGLDLENFAEIAPGAFAAAAADAANDAWESAASVGSFLMQQKLAEEEGDAAAAAKGWDASSKTSGGGGGHGEKDAHRRRRVGRVEIIDETEVTGVGKDLVAGSSSIVGDEVSESTRAVSMASTTRSILEEITARLEETKAAVGGDAPARIDDEKARELDDSVTSLKGPLDSLMKDISVLPDQSGVAPIPVSSTVAEEASELSSTKTTAEMDAVTTTSGAVSEATTGKRQRWRRFFGREAKWRGRRSKAAEKAAVATPARQMEERKRVTRKKSASLPLSHPDHYTDRIGRDMRHLAVSVASSIDTPDQWKTFCDEGGGLLPLLHCIRNGARRVVDGGPEAYTLRNGSGGIVDLGEQYEEEFDAACAACRSLRDLCAISKEFSAYVTDGILRADAAWSMSVPNGEIGNDSEDDNECSSGGLISDLVALLRHANEAEKVHTQLQMQQPAGGRRIKPPSRRSRREARRRCGLYVLQLLLAMSVASDAAVNTLRSTSGVTEAVRACSSYAPAEQRRRWLRYPVEVIKRRVLRRGVSRSGSSSRPFLAAASVSDGLTGQVQRTANMVLAAVGHNAWVPKMPGQKGLRILCLDGGGTRGVTAITTLLNIVQAMGGIEVCDSFDIIAGTSTGAIIAFLVGLRRESSVQAKKRYDKLIKRIFVKSALSTPMLVFTTAAYDEAHFNKVMKEILKETSMLDSRADPTVPLVFALSSKMSSNPIQVALFRNYNYAGGELPDPFVIDPEEAREALGLDVEDDIMSEISNWSGSVTKPGKCAPRIGEGSRNPGSFRVLQRAALRATTAAPTFFKPVKMGGELYSDGGIIASNPAAIAIHEARTLFPDVPIEMVVSCGTGAFIEEKTPPRIGWDGIIGQIVSSATDGEQIHHILEDVLGQGGTAKRGLSSVSGTRYYRLNPVVGMPDDFGIDETSPEKLGDLSRITDEYLQEEEQQRKLKEISEVLEGKKGWAKFLSW